MKLILTIIILSTLFLPNNLHNKVLMNGPPNCGAGWKMSEAYFISKPSSTTPITVIPKITITSGKIKISHYEFRGGKITVTTLIGSGGSYTLPEGEHNINPGIYDHQLGDGQILGVGEIHSYICYQ